MNKTLGIILIALGLFGLAWGGIYVYNPAKGGGYRADPCYPRHYA